MDDSQARKLLHDERTRVESLLADLARTGEEDRDASRATGDMADPAQPLTDEQNTDAVAAGLRARVDALARAEARLDAGTYGRSVQSGTPIPDERLEADPAAELTVEEEAGRTR